MIVFSENGRTTSFWTNYGLIGALAAFRFALYLYTGDQYNYFRDEFYYIACSDHLAWGYVDQPPLSILLLKFNRLLLGDSLYALRLMPALCIAVCVFIVGLIARELGGGKFAQAIAGLCVIINPVLLFTGNYFSMNCFDALVWAIAGYLLILIVRRKHSRYWLWMGLLLGLGLMNKISVMWLVAGIGLGIVLTPARHYLRTKELWIAAGLAILIFLPHVFWQVANGWPTVEFMHNASVLKYAALSPLRFLIGQIVELHPLACVIAMIGLGYLLFNASGRPYRILGVVFLTVLGILLVNGNSKGSYMAGAYLPIYAAGGVALERLLSRSRRRWIGTLFMAILIAGGAATAPMALPILPVETYVRYAEAVGIAPTTSERKELAELPQHYADQFGWENMVETVAKTYHCLSADDQRRCVILGINYGEAGAIDFYGRKYGLPHAVSEHNNYWLWGPGNRDWDVVLVVGRPADVLTSWFASVVTVDTIRSRYAMPYENNMPLHVCRNFKLDRAVFWQEFKHYE
jgi:hypothetical protein